MNDDEIIQFMRESDRPFITSTDLAEEAEIARQNAYRRLQRLHEAGRIEKYKAGGSAVCWWVPDT